LTEERKVEELLNKLAAMLENYEERDVTTYKVIEGLSDAQLHAVGAVEELAEAINRSSRGLYQLALKSLDDAIEELKRALDLLTNKKEESEK